MVRGYSARLAVAWTVATFVALLSCVPSPSGARDTPAFSYSQRRFSTAAVQADADQNKLDDDYPFSDTFRYEDGSKRFTSDDTPAFSASRHHDWTLTKTIPRQAGKTFTQLNARVEPVEEEPITPSQVLGLGGRGYEGGGDQASVDYLAVGEEPALPAEPMPEPELPPEPPKRFAAARSRLAGIRRRMASWKRRAAAKVAQLRGRIRGLLQRRKGGRSGGGLDAEPPALEMSGYETPSQNL